MPGRIEWDNEEKTILLMIYEGNMLLEEYYRVTDQTFEAISPLSHTVHTIMLRQNVKSVPATMSKVLQYANKKTTPNLGINVIVGATAMTKMLVRLAKVIAPRLAKEVYFANSLEEARQIIAEKSADMAKSS
jgi:hypothetical protein